MFYQVIQLDIDQVVGVVMIMFNWFDKLNSFMWVMYCELQLVFDEVEVVGVCVLILMGVGCGFCVGQDLVDFDFMLGVFIDFGMLIDEYFNLLICCLQCLLILVIVVVNGMVVGVGVNFVFVCDLVFVVCLSSFIQVFVKIGFVFDLGGMWFLL